MVNNKLKAAFSNELTPIMCIGETLREREEGFTNTKVGTQILEGLKGLTPEQVASMVIAYEPIWAIGTGKTATSADAQETIHQIREYVREAFEGAADDVRIQYGGSVNAGQHRRAHGAAGHRRRPGGRSEPRPRPSSPGSCSFE